MEYVDAFSVRYNFVSTDLVKDIHKNGKKIYAWTVDGETQIKKLLLYDVDGIITNDPYNSKDIVYNANNSIVVDLLTRITESGF
jgi:glycerophosphoryl diester phosphodiesterase